MDIETIDKRYQDLQTAANQVGQAFSDFSAKLQQAAGGGDEHARDWQLELKGLALQVRDEQGQATNLLQAMHDFIVTTLQQHEQAQQAADQARQQAQEQAAQQQAQQQAAQQQAQQQPPGYPSPYQQAGYGYGGGFGGFGGGGMLSRFIGGGFGRAIAMGAGFGLGDDLINSIL